MHAIAPHNLWAIRGVKKGGLILGDVVVKTFHACYNVPKREVKKGRRTLQNVVTKAFHACYCGPKREVKNKLELS